MTSNHAFKNLINQFSRQCTWEIDPEFLPLFQCPQSWLLIGVLVARPTKEICELGNLNLHSPPLQTKN